MSTNIHELDGAGRPCVGWCFAPKGSLAAGDVMLAQKIALETDERSALTVANSFPLKVIVEPAGIALCPIGPCAGGYNSVPRRITEATVK
jgi:hypothetical protein